MENPQGENGEEMTSISPASMGWDGSVSWEQEAMGSPDFGGMQAVSATTAAYHADVAAKHAATLAQYVQYLQWTLGSLQNKVTELEDWKKRALDEVRKLREDHKQLRRKVLGESANEETPGLPSKSESMPAVAARFASASGSGAEPKGLPLTDTRPQDSSGEIPSLPPTTGFSLASEMSFSDLDAGQLEGVTVAPGDVNGVACERAEWRIGHLSTKLRGCMGRTLVSSPFTVAGLEDLRLMICPDEKEATKGPRSRRQKELYAKKVMDGPLEGCLKLKAPIASDAHEIEYFLKVGSKRMGPFTHNFAESTVSGCDDFGVDWLKQLEPDLSLTVCVELLHPKAAA